MLINIAGFIKKLLPSFDKSDLEDDLEISLESISVIQETYTNLEEVTKVAKFTSKTIKNLIKDFYKNLDDIDHKLKISSSKNINTDTINIFKNVKVNGDYILKEINDAVNDVVVSQALTAYKANLLRSVAHYFFMTRFALDLANFFYTVESEESGLELSKEFKLNNKQKEFIVNNIWIYARLLTVYGVNHDIFVNKLESIDEITLPKDNIDEVINAFNLDKIDMFNNLPSNFIGSPIYSIRLVFAQWESDRYRNLKDKRKLLELRYLYLKLLKEKNQTDINIEKEIEYLQKRITDIDYQLAKIEKDIEEN